MQLNTERMAVFSFCCFCWYFKIILLLIALQLYRRCWLHFVINNNDPTFLRCGPIKTVLILSYAYTMAFPVLLDEYFETGPWKHIMTPRFEIKHFTKIGKLYPNLWRSFIALGNFRCCDRYVSPEWLTYHQLYRIIQAPSPMLTYTTKLCVDKRVPECFVCCRRT